MRSMLGVATFGLLVARCFVDSIDGAEHTAEGRTETKDEPQEHHPRLRAEPLVHVDADDEANRDRQAHLETDRARIQRVVHTLSLAGGGVGSSYAHAVSMRVLLHRILRHFAAMGGRGGQQAGRGYHARFASSIED